MLGVVAIQRRLTAKSGWINGYYIKARLLNFWRITPFVDVPAVLDSFDKHGLPMCLDGEVTSPPGTGPDTFLEVLDAPEVEMENVQVMIQTLRLFAPIARAFGLPAWIDHEPSSDTPYYEALQQAGGRAMDVQRRRNERARKDS